MSAVLEQVSAAMATATEGGRHVHAFGAGHSLSLVSQPGSIHSQR
jgi:uncharacterized phosphosugar-binding protein